MLEAFGRVMTATGGARLYDQGRVVVEPVMVACFGPDADPTQVYEVLLILNHVVTSLMIQYATGKVAAENILPVLEITIRRVTSGSSGGSVRTRTRSRGVRSIVP
jgi:hypothetical protein